MSPCYSVYMIVSGIELSVRYIVWSYFIPMFCHVPQSLHIVCSYIALKTVWPVAARDMVVAGRTIYQVLWRGLCGTLKRVCDTLKRVVWYFKEGGRYFEEGGGEMFYQIFQLINPFFIIWLISSYDPGWWFYMVDFYVGGAHVLSQYWILRKGSSSLWGYCHLSYRWTIMSSCLSCCFWS